MHVYFSKPWMGLFSYFIALLVFITCFALFVWQSRRKNKYSPFTEDSLRPPGHTLRLRRTAISESIDTHYFFFLFVASGLVVSTLLLSGLQLHITSVLLLITLAIVLVRTWHLFGKAQGINLGLEGEEYTGQELNLLMLSGAYVFHDIPYQGGGNINHIVIAKDKIFVVETKARRKPQSSTGGRNSTVIYDGKYLKFPDVTTDEPLTQAKRHADFLSAAIKKHCQLDFPVKAVVSLPGWFIENETNTKSTLVINPKRGKALKPWLGEVSNQAARDRVANYIASVARSVTYKSTTTDPDAAKNYDVWLKPRVREKSLGL